MRKFLNYCRSILFVLFVIALGWSVSCPGEAAETSTKSNDITVETKVPITDENNNSIFTGLEKTESLLDSQIRNNKVTDISSQSLSRSYIETNAISVSSSTYGSSGWQYPWYNIRNSLNPPYIGPGGTSYTQVKFLEDESQYYYENYDYLYYQFADSSNNIYTAGDRYLRKYSADYQLLWEFIGPGNQSLYEYCLDEANNRIICTTKFGFTVYSVSMVDGSINWTYTVSTSGFVGSCYPYVDPVTDNIYVNCRQDNDANNKGMWCFDTNGNFLWHVRYATHWPYQYNSINYLALPTDSSVLVCGYDFDGGDVWGVNPLNGDIIWHWWGLQNSNWRSSYAGQNRPVISADNSRVIFRDDFYNIQCLDINTGNNIWTYNIYPQDFTQYYNATKWHENICVHDDGTVYFTHFDNENINNNAVYCLNPDGTLKWKYQEPTFGNSLYLDLVDSNGDAYLRKIDSSNNYYLVKMNGADGSILGESMIPAGWAFYGTILNDEESMLTIFKEPYEAWVVDDYYEEGGYWWTFYNYHVYAFGSQTCTTDKTTLGIRPYSLYGNGSVNLSTGNFVMEQTDIAMPSIGPSLHFTRFYNSTDTYEGTQGKGWTHNYNTHLNINPDQSINVAYPDGQELKFTYNGSGYDRPAGCFETLQAGPDSTYILTFKDQTKYTYNSAGQLTSITDKNSNTLTLSYTNGLMTNATEPGGRSLTFGYEDNLLSTVTDSAGRSVGYTYNNRQLETVEGVRDYIIQYQYNEQGLTTIIDPDNITILHNDYDSCSRVISQTDGRGNVTGFNFTQANQTTVTDAVYKNTIVEYDDKYRSTKVTYPGPGNITESFVYDDNNCFKEITDGRSNTTYYNYDNFGNLLKITDPGGNETIMTYTGYNNLDTVTNAVYDEIDFGYDAVGNLKTMEDPFGKITSYDYYDNGLLQRITTPSDENIGSGKTLYNYYPDGMLQSVTDEVYNTTTTFGYDDFDHLRTITDPALKTTTIYCDAADNITDLIDPLGHTTSYTYDWRGNVLTKTDVKGIITKYTYNNVGLLESKIDAFNILNYETVYGYNDLNQLETVTDPRGYQTTYSYDDLGRLNGITDPLGHTTGCHYDNAGNLEGITDAYGKQVLTVGYDSRNNPETITDALGHTTTNTYTGLSSLDTSEDPLGYITNLDYDALNRLNYTTDATTTGHGSQNFDAHGNRSNMIDPNTNTTVFRFDPSNRVRSITTAAGGSTDIDYNSRSLISWKRNARGQETTYEYYDNGLLHFFTNPDGMTTYTYDGNGNLLTASDSNGTIEYRYDELNRVKEYIDASGNLIGYTYDENSNLKTITYPGGKQVTYGYTPNNQLETVTDWEDRITSYEYDHNGRLKKTTRPDGTVEIRNYKDNGKLEQLKDIDAGGNIISQYDYEYYASGNIKDDNNSNEAGPYTFNSAALTYDADNRLGTYNGQTVNYDAEGNMTQGPLAGQMVNFTFDARSRLTGAGDTSYTYDAGNKRIRVSEGVHQISYVVNPNAPLSQVLTATDEQNNKTYYVYGLGLIGQESAGGSYRSYHFDHLGSTIALTSESGIITDRFQYAPYGELVYRSGSTATPFLFNGQYGVMTDESDLYYMRARYYNPIAKRFLSPDTLIGNISNPQSQNRYIYCEGNPANYIDPTGHDWTRAQYFSSEFSSMEYGELYDLWVSLDQLINNELTIIYGDSYNSWDKNQAQIVYKDLYLQQRMTNLFLIIRGDYSQEDKDYAQAGLASILDEEAKKEGEKAVAGLGGAVVGKVASPAVVRLIPAATGTGQAVDPNKLNHIFGKAQHNLAEFLAKYNGNQIEAYKAIESATKQQIAAKNIIGVFEEAVSVNGTQIIVRGNVVNGEVKIGTAFIP